VDRAPGTGTGVGRVGLEVVDVTRLPGDTSTPCLASRSSSELVPRFVRDVHVAVHGDVGDRVRVGDQEVVLGQMVVQDSQYLLTRGLSSRSGRIAGCKPSRLEA